MGFESFCSRLSQFVERISPKLTEFVAYLRFLFYVFNFQPTNNQETNQRCEGSLVVKGPQLDSPSLKTDFVIPVNQ